MLGEQMITNAMFESHNTLWHMWAGNSRALSAADSEGIFTSLCPVETDASEYLQYAIWLAMVTHIYNMCATRVPACPQGTVLCNDVISMLSS